MLMKKLWKCVTAAQTVRQDFLGIGIQHLVQLKDSVLVEYKGTCNHTIILRREGEFCVMCMAYLIVLLEQLL